MHPELRRSGVWHERRVRRHLHGWDVRDGSTLRRGGLRVRPDVVLRLLRGEHVRAWHAGGGLRRRGNHV